MGFDKCIKLQNWHHTNDSQHLVFINALLEFSSLKCKTERRDLHLIFIIIVIIAVTL